uniref:Hypoxia up-regulated protein 1 n=1 Tax=Caenorhabditis japonica TaxID=281687 RepID=A0A8R1DSN6_CAEJA
MICFLQIDVQDADKNPLSTVEISGVKDAIEKEVTDDNSILKGVKTTFSIDLSGIVSVEKASVVVEKNPTDEEKQKYEDDKKEYEEWEKEQEELKKKEKAEKKEKEEKKKNGEESSDQEKKTEDVTETGEKKEETEKPVKVKKSKPVEPKAKKINVPLNIVETKTDNIDLNAEEVTSAKKILGDFEQKEKEKHDREEAMNSLEGLLYDLAVKLEDGEEYAEYATEEEKKAILEEVGVLKLWFEDDVSLDTKKEEFDEKRTKLLELTAKPDARKKERLDIPKVTEVLEEHFNRSLTFHAMALNLTQHEEEGNKTFTDTELEVLTKLIESTTEWWNEKKELFDKQPMNEDPVVKASEIAEKARDLEREVRYLVNKIKIASAKKAKEEKKKTKKEENKDSKKNETTTETPENGDEPEETPPKEESATEEEQKKEEHDASEL